MADKEGKKAQTGSKSDSLEKQRKIAARYCRIFGAPTAEALKMMQAQQKEK